LVIEKGYKTINKLSSEKCPDNKKNSTFEVEINNIIIKPKKLKDNGR
jgi:hypothetical protein